MAEARTAKSAEALFRVLWDALVSLLGTTATATLLRRAVRRAAPRIPGLAEVRIRQEGLEYTYALPASWRDPADAAALTALRHLVAEELEPLLRELTGGVVRRHLSRIAALAALGLSEEDRHER